MRTRSSRIMSDDPGPVRRTFTGSPVDCLVAVVAVRSDVPVLQRDRDFDVLTEVLPRLRLHLAGD